MKSLKEKITKLIQMIKEDRRLAITAGILCLILGLFIISIISESKRAPILAPVLRIKEKETPKTPLDLTEVWPKDGDSKDMMDNVSPIIFTFNMPVDINSLKLWVSPFLLVDKYVDKNNPNKLYIRPKNDGWIRQLNYTITIAELKSTSGDPISKQIIYHYYIDPPLTLQNIPD